MGQLLQLDMYSVTWRVWSEDCSCSFPPASNQAVHVGACPPDSPSESDREREREGGMGNRNRARQSYRWVPAARLARLPCGRSDRSHFGFASWDERRCTRTQLRRLSACLAACEPGCLGPRGDSDLRDAYLTPWRSRRPTLRASIPRYYASAAVRKTPAAAGRAMVFSNRSGGESSHFYGKTPVYY